MVGASLLLAPSALANKGPKADLAIVSVKHQGYSFPDQPFRVKVRTENRGKKKIGGQYAVTVDDPALPSLPGSGQRFPLEKIKPDHVSKDVFEVSVLPLGRYEIKVCVKSKADKKEGNDCRKGKDFSVIPKQWRGAASATGTDALGGTRVDSATRCCQTNFHFDSLTPAGFRYYPAGTVEESISGGNPPCTADGYGTFDITEESDLLLSEDLEVYAALGVPPAGSVLQGTQTCFGVTSPLLGSVFHNWLQTGPRDTTPGATRLEGTYSETLGSLSLTWKWDLTAQL